MIRPRLPPAIIPMGTNECIQARNECAPWRPRSRPNTPRDRAPPIELHTAKLASLADGSRYAYLISVLDVPQQNSASSANGIQRRLVMGPSPLVGAYESPRPPQITSVTATYCRGVSDSLRNQRAKIMVSAG